MQHLCGICAIPHENKHKRVLSLQASFDSTDIALGHLRSQVGKATFNTRSPSPSEEPIRNSIVGPPSSILRDIEVPQRTCVTKILPNFRVNFLVRFASKVKTLVLLGSGLELFRKVFGTVCVIFLRLWGGFGIPYLALEMQTHLQTPFLQTPFPRRLGKSRERL